MNSIIARAIGAVLAAAVAGGLAGCDDDVTGTARQVGPASPDFGLDPANARGMPSGRSAIERFDVTFTKTELAPDEFSRSTPATRMAGYGSCAGLSSTATRCWAFAAFVRDSLRDPRLPQIATTAPKTVNFCSVAGPEFFADVNVKMFEIFCRLTGLEAGQPYFLSLVRYGLKVNGLLDAAEVLVSGRASEPDSLILLDPAPGGHPTVNYNWVTNLGCNNNPVVADANPFYLGPATVAATRVLTFDKCFASGTTYYSSKTAVVPDSAPFLLNRLATPTHPQQYNYLEITQGSTPGGRVVARAQVGVDLDPTTEQPIANAFAPFPNAALPRNQTRSIAEIAVNTASFRVLPLEPTASGGAYRIVGIDRVGGTATPLTARYWTVRTDTTGRDEVGNVITEVTVSDTSQVTEIHGGAPNVAHHILVTNALNPSAPLVQFTDVGLQPTSAQGGVPIWGRLLTRLAGSATEAERFFEVDTLRFGTLRLEAGATEYVYRPAGSASGTNRGSEIGIEFRHLPRPPIGFFYNAWLVSAEGDRPPVSLGELRTPLPELASLRDADISAQIAGVLTGTEVLVANVLLRPADLAALGASTREYDTVRVTLEAKDGVSTIAPIVVLEGPFPIPASP